MRFFGFHRLNTDDFAEQKQPQFPKNDYEKIVYFTIVDGSVFEQLFSDGTY